MSMNFEFSKRENRCCLCGGELTDYEKRFNYPDHVQRSLCVEVLQNTLTLKEKNEDKLEKLISALIEFVELRIPNLEEDWIEKLDDEASA